LAASPAAKAEPPKTISAAAALATRNSFIILNLPMD
jgi:hypothetical protein